MRRERNDDNIINNLYPFYPEKPSPLIFLKENYYGIQEYGQDGVATQRVVIRLVGDLCQTDK